MTAWCPFVSVIIPTHNRCTILPRTLNALATQTYPSDKMELILVADGCTDGTVSYAHSCALPFRCQVLELPGQGPAAARNYATAHASGELLIFIDDDVEMVPGFVAAHVRAHRPHPEIVAVGYLPLAGQATGYFGRGIREWWEGKFFSMRQPGYRFRYSDLFSGNFSLRKAFFHRVNGFNSDLRCHEDYELGLRLLAAGAIFAFVTEAKGIHHDATHLERSLDRRRAEGKADFYLASRHPRLCYQLPLAQHPRSFFNRTLRYLAFRLPSLGDGVATFLRHRLDILERLRLRSGWRQLLSLLQDYWYWRGVAEESGSPQAVSALFASTEDSEPEMYLDLAQGMAAAERLLDAKRPNSVSIRMGDQEIGEIPTIPGMERLRGAHLRPLLAEKFSTALMLALMQEKLTATPVRQLSNPQYPPQESTPRRTPKASSQNSPRKLMKVLEIDLAQQIADIDVTAYQGLHVLVRYQKRPLGWITLSNLEASQVSADTLRQRALDDFGWEILPEAWGYPPAQATDMPPISVVVCTRDRTELLAGCLEALQALDYPDYEILVVDNVPRSKTTAQLVADLPVRYVREHRPGLDWARNRGIIEAQHTLIAFTDDDARPDTNWLRAMARAFAEPEVMAVTGPVLPMELDTPAQTLFEFDYGGMSHGFERRILRRRQLRETELLWASSFGVGANMAFRRDLFVKIGDFDVALDVGTPSGGGGDVEIFHRTVARGHTLVYEPEALVWHRHRRYDAALEKLVANNGRSFGAYLLTCARNQTVGKAEILTFALRHWLWGWIGRRLLQPNSFSRRLVWREFKAALGSPRTYSTTQQRAQGVRTMPVPQPLGVSIIVPAFNAAGTIAQTLESLYAQTFPRWEAIVVDDGSTDETAAVVSEFVRQDDRFRLVSQPQQGGSAARNHGLSLARHDWLLFLDADDWLLPRHLERMTKEIWAKPSLDVIHCGWTRVMPDGALGRPTYAPDHYDMFDLFTQTCAIQLNAALARRSLVQEVGGFDTSLSSCQDWDFWQRMARTGARFGAVRAILARYRTRPGSVSQDAARLMVNGLRVITQGHAPDPRVVEPAPVHRHGRSSAHLAHARLRFASWPAGLMLGGGQDARPLLVHLQEDTEPDLDPAHVADFIFESALLPNGLLPQGWGRLWPRVQDNVIFFLEALEKQANAPGLAQASLHRLADLILNVVVERPITIGDTKAVRIEVTDPIPDVDTVASVQRLVCDVRLEGNALGRLELPAHDDNIPGSRIADAIATDYAWPILGRFFEHTLYPYLRLEEGETGFSLWRGDVCLARDLPGNEQLSWSQIFEKVGWTLFLQELWARPNWSEDRFCHNGPMEEATREPCYGQRLNLAVTEAVPDTIVPGQELKVTLMIGKVTLKEIAVPARQGRITAQALRAALVEAAGFELCRLAVREGLIGTPLNEGPSLRARLATPVVDTEQILS